MLTRSHARSIGWAVVLAVCFALTVALTFRVNAVKSQVRLAERQMMQLRMEKSLLETEFETRANQQQLTALNEVEFGYQAPTAAQYLESERQLAALGKPRGPDAPQMIRVATSDPASRAEREANPLAGIVNPLTGKAIAAEVPRDPIRARELAKGSSPADLVERLSHIEKTPQPLGKKAAALVPLTDRPAAKLAGKKASEDLGIKPTKLGGKASGDDKARLGGTSGAKSDKSAKKPAADTRPAPVAAKAKAASPAAKASAPARPSVAKAGPKTITPKPTKVAAKQ